MLLTITTTKPQATDLGYLLHKHPDRLQTFDLSFGKAKVFYPEADDNICTAALMSFPAFLTKFASAKTKKPIASRFEPGVHSVTKNDSLLERVPAGIRIN